MRNKTTSKLERWRTKYASLAVAIGCLYSVVVSWGDNWLIPALLSAGGLICGTIGFFDLKRIFKKSV
ncbi:hypothetical protein [Neobacillus soli]|uniref:hypothetical protein n=1 Tax=Neobacillus soli TaxID=220688 RepID=UPI00082475A6|nr:hypothetical protein [Neobacillus soli]